MFVIELGNRHRINQAKWAIRGVLGGSKKFASWAVNGLEDGSIFEVSTPRGCIRFFVQKAGTIQY